MNDDLNIDRELLFPVLRETNTNALGKPSHLDVRKNFSSLQRVIIPWKWNELPQYFAEISCSIDSFKCNYIR